MSCVVLSHRPARPPLYVHVVTHPSASPAAAGCIIITTLLAVSTSPQTKPQQPLQPHRHSTSFCSVSVLLFLAAGHYQQRWGLDRRQRWISLPSAPLRWNRSRHSTAFLSLFLSLLCLCFYSLCSCLSCTEIPVSNLTTKHTENTTVLFCKWRI